MANKKLNDLNLRDTGKRFLTSIKASSHYSPGYLAALEQTVAMFAAYGEEQAWPETSGIAIEHIEDYFAYLQSRPRWYGRQGDKSQPISGAYLDGQYRRLHRFFKWCVERRYADHNPMSAMPKPHVDQKVVETVPEDAMRTLLAMVDPVLASTAKHRLRLLRDRAALYLLWDTPGRRNEVSTLGLKDVDLDNGMVLVLGKGGRERWMPIGHKTQDMIWEYLDARAHLRPTTPNLWVSSQGREMQPGWLWSMVKRLRERAGLPELRTHQFRHSYTMAALRSGMQEHILRTIAGWKKYVPATYYRTLSVEDAKMAHESMSPADKLGSTGYRAAKRVSRQGKGKL